MKSLNGKQTRLRTIYSCQGSKGKRNSSQFPVTIAEGIHLFPSRTQKLSPQTSMVLGWQRPGRVDSRRILNTEKEAQASFFAVIVFGLSGKKG